MPVLAHRHSVRGILLARRWRRRCIGVALIGIRRVTLLYRRRDILRRRIGRRLIGTAIHIGRSRRRGRRFITIGIAAIVRWRRRQRLKIARRILCFDLTLDQRAQKAFQIRRWIGFLLHADLLDARVDLVRRGTGALGENALRLVLLSAGGQGGAGQRDQGDRTEICQPRHQRLR